MKYHVKNILRKLGATSRADAVARYVRASEAAREPAPDGTPELFSGPLGVQLHRRLQRARRRRRSCSADPTRGRRRPDDAAAASCPDRSAGRALPIRAGAEAALAPPSGARAAARAL